VGFGRSSSKAYRKKDDIRLGREPAAIDAARERRYATDRSVASRRSAFKTKEINWSWN
jgi:hypothetical protein